MSKRQIIMLLGAFVMILLFLGIPSSWDKFFALVAGFLIVAVAYRSRPEMSQSSMDAMAPASHTPYVEHRADAPAPTPAYEPAPAPQNENTVA